MALILRGNGTVEGMTSAPDLAAGNLKDITTGNYNPTYVSSSDGSDLTINEYFNQVGNWQKIGRWVTVTIDIATTGTTGVGTPTGNLGIRLPFTVANESYFPSNNVFQGQGIGYSYRFNGDDPKSIIARAGYNYAQVYYEDTGTTELDTAVPVSAIYNVAITGVYHRIMATINYLAAE